MHPVFYLATFVTFLCAMGLLASILLTRTSRAASDRLFEVTDQENLLRGRKSARGQWKTQLLAAATWLRKTLKISHKAEAEEKFVAAGMGNSASRDMYTAIRVVAPLLGALGGSFIDWHRTFCITLLAGVGYLGPDIALKRMIKKRREKIRRGLPDAIDLLVICVDAGLGIDQAMLRVSNDLVTSHPDLHTEFQIINREQRAGKQRLDAWESMAKRTALAEVEGFVNMLGQTERFGTPIARALSAFADGLRQKRRQRAEELAAKTTVKIMFPLVFFIFPTLFIVLIGPAVLNIMHTLLASK